MNVNQYQKYHKNTRNMKKGILASNIGALPILQECPSSNYINIEETGSHYINIEETSSHCINIEETSSHV